MHVSRADRGQGHRRAAGSLFAFDRLRMLSGRRAFEEQQCASVMAAILEQGRHPFQRCNRVPRLRLIDSLGLVWPKIQTIATTQTARDLAARAAVGGKRGYRAGDTGTHQHRRGRPRMIAALSRGIAAVAGLSYVAASWAALPRDCGSRRPARRLPPKYPAISPAVQSSPSRRTRGNPSDLGEADCRRRAAGSRAADGYLRPRWSPDSSSIIFFRRHPAVALGDAVGILRSAASRAALAASRMPMSATTARDSPSFDRPTANSRLMTADRDGANNQVIVRLEAGYSAVSPSLVAGRYADRVATKQDEPRR